MSAAMPLLRALARSAPPFTLHSIETRPWASATFTGERHRLCLETDDDAVVAQWLAAVPELELGIHRYLLADLAVAAVERAGGTATVTLDALTLDDC